MTVPFWIILPDHDMGICFLAKETRVDFRVFEMMDIDGDWAISDNHDPHSRSEWEEIDFEITGHIKWDGCINWQTNGSTMMHGCTPSHLEEITQIFTTIYAIAKEHHDLLGDAVKPLPETAIRL